LQDNLENIVNKTNRRSTDFLFLAISQVIAFSCLLFLHIGAMAQQASDGNLAASPVGGSADNSAPLQASSSAVQLLPAAEPAAEPPRNFKERFQDYRSATFSPWAVVMPAFGAGLSQWRNYPPEWNQGTEGFGKRVASAYGGSVLEDTISFGVATFDHEDLRYPLSTYPKNAFLKRAGHTLSYTFIPKKEGGGRSFGWSRLIGAYGSGFIANTWYPAQHSDVHNAVVLGSMNLAGDLAINLLKEFIRPHVQFGNTKKTPSTKTASTRKEEDKKGN
jgi:hypothetical protein